MSIPIQESTADRTKLAYVGSRPDTRDSNAWFTPLRYLDAVRKSLGGVIDLDPFSSAEANVLVNAVSYFDVDDDAFEQDWAASVGPEGTCWMNPPYSGRLVQSAVQRYLDEYERGTFAEGIVLVNNATETRWAQRAVGLSGAVCFTDHRISFWNADGKAMSGNTRGQMFLYFGAHPLRFVEEFAEIGVVILTTSTFHRGARAPHPRKENHESRG